MHLTDRRRRQRASFTSTTREQVGIQVLDLARRQPRQPHVTNARHHIGSYDRGVVRHRRIGYLLTNPPLPAIHQEPANRVRGPSHRTVSLALLQRLPQGRLRIGLRLWSGWRDLNPRPLDPQGRAPVSFGVPH